MCHVTQRSFCCRIWISNWIRTTGLIWNLCRELVGVQAAASRPLLVKRPWFHFITLHYLLISLPPFEALKLTNFLSLKVPKPQSSKPHEKILPPFFSHRLLNISKQWPRRPCPCSSHTDETILATIYKPPKLCPKKTCHGSKKM